MSRGDSCDRVRGILRSRNILCIGVAESRSFLVGGSSRSTVLPHNSHFRGSSDRRSRLVLSGDGYIDVGVSLRGHRNRLGQSRFGSFGDVSNSWWNILGGRSARVFAFYFARLFFCDFRDWSLRGLLFDLSFHFLQCSLYLPYYLPPNVANFFIAITLNCIKPLEKAIQSILVGAHWCVIRGDCKFTTVKVENRRELEGRLERGKPRVCSTDGGQRRDGIQGRGGDRYRCSTMPGRGCAARGRWTLDLYLHLHVSHSQ